MLHGPDTNRAALGLADRIWTAATTDHDRIRFAFRLVFSREPTARDNDRILRSLSELSRDALASNPNPTAAEKEAALKSAWQQVALVLLNSNEFVYVP
jgi:hypothetical protein